MKWGDEWFGFYPLTIVGCALCILGFNLGSEIQPLGFGLWAVGAVAVAVSIFVIGKRYR